MNQTTYIQQMANYVNEIKYEDLPYKVVDKVKICIMDALECCISPMTDIRGEATIKAISKKSDNPTTLFCTGFKADAIDAAYYNTVKGSITSRNDIHMAAGVHAGAVVVPTAFAVCEERGLSGKELIEAVLTGYETMVRFGSFLAGKMNHSWRTTAVFSPVGAAFTAAKASGLTAHQTMSAASFACNSCCGFNEWALSGTGEDVFQNAAGARNGIFSSRLAEGGASGCPTIIEGKNGLAEAFGIHEGFDKLISDFHTKWFIEGVVHKPIDSCVIVQTPCQVAMNLLTKHPYLHNDDIEKINIEMSSGHINHPGCSNKDINSLVQGIMSICLGVASTINNRSWNNIKWMPPFDDSVLKLMDKCNLIKNPEFTENKKSATRITIQMKNGDSYEEEQYGLVPLTDEEVRQKFNDTCSNIIGKLKTKKIESLIWDLEHVDNISDLTSCIE